MRYNWNFKIVEKKAFKPSNKYKDEKPSSEEFGLDIIEFENILEYRKINFDLPREKINLKLEKVVRIIDFMVGTIMYYFIPIPLIIIPVIFVKDQEVKRIVISILIGITIVLLILFAIISFILTIIRGILEVKEDDLLIKEASIPYPQNIQYGKLISYRAAMKEYEWWQNKKSNNEKV